MTTGPADHPASSTAGWAYDDGFALPPSGPTEGCLVLPCPAPGELLAAVLDEWELIDTGEHPYSADLPRPWEPATCTAPALRRELWEWLDLFVRWVNQQCLWDPGDLIPPCWPDHPHLVHEIAVLAEQRRQAGQTTTATALEQWQTHTLPNFLTRCHDRLRRHCDTDHQPTPAAAAHARYNALTETAARQASFGSDLTATAHNTHQGLDTSPTAPTPGVPS